MRREQLDSDDPDIAASLSQLGLTLSQLGKYDEAEASLREALPIEEKHPERTQLLMAHALHNLAFTLRAHGKLSEAEDVYRKAWAV